MVELLTVFVLITALAAAYSVVSVVRPLPKLRTRGRSLVAFGGTFLILVVLMVARHSALPEAERHRLAAARDAAAARLAHEGAAPERWLRDYYDMHPVGGGWSVSRIQQRRGDVDVLVVIPESQASRIMRNPVPMQLAAIASGCPGKLEKIWTLLGSGDTVLIRGAAGTPDEVFIDVDCRQHGH